MCNKIKFKKIKAREIKPGMVINTRPNDNDVYGYCLVTACSGYVDISYTHFNYNDSFGGQMVGTLNGKDKVLLITGETRNSIIKNIKDDVFKALHYAERNVDLIRLIESMS